MKKIAVLLTVLIFAAVAFAANKGPAEIDMSTKFEIPKMTKKAVMFPHAKHQDKNDCTECHMTAEGGALKNLKKGKSGELKPGKVKGAGNKVHKEFCFPCHKKKKVKKGTSCKKCH